MPPYPTSSIDSNMGTNWTVGVSMMQSKGSRIDEGIYVANEDLYTTCISSSSQKMGVWDQCNFNLKVLVGNPRIRGHALARLLRGSGIRAPSSARTFSVLTNQKLAFHRDLCSYYLKCTLHSYLLFSPLFWIWSLSLDIDDRYSKFELHSKALPKEKKLWVGLRNRATNSWVDLRAPKEERWSADFLLCMAFGYCLGYDETSNDHTSPFPKEEHTVVSFKHCLSVSDN
ncbi:hypothetical protein C8R42DRAFT_270349 [Lentinula raphanica]|nr:hypothetical protein C8R42DRAFT_270349 [Lentinula raphanica]